MKDNLKIIQELHKTDFKFVIVSSGGGSNAVGTLLKVPGASNSVLEAYIPYAKESLDFYLLKPNPFFPITQLSKIVTLSFITEFLKIVLDPILQLSPI